MGARTDAARSEVLAARAGLDEELVRLEAAGRAAVDIPARLRREPAKVLGAVGGAAFLLLGGPKRVLKGVRTSLFGAKADMPKSMLPPEVEKTLKKLGPDGDKVRGTLEREFAAYLDEKAPQRKERDLGATAAVLLGGAFKPGHHAARQAARRARPGPGRPVLRRGHPPRPRARPRGHQRHERHGRHERLDLNAVAASRLTGRAWWARRGSNPHAPHGAPAPKAGASAIPPLARAEDTARCGSMPPRAVRDPHLYFAAMNVTVTPAPRSSLNVRVEVPPERLDAAIAEAVRHLSQRTKIDGFRPGKAPRAMVERVVGAEAVLEEAMDHLVQRAYRDALLEQDILPLTKAEVNVEQGEEGKPVIFSATVQIRPEVVLGDYRNFNFKPEIEAIDEPKVAKVIEELRDQNATLAPVEDRGARNGDYAVIGYTGTRDGVAFEGGSAERMPLILGEERLHPGLRGATSSGSGPARRLASTSPSRTTIPRRASPASRPGSRSSCASSARRSSPRRTTSSRDRSAASRTSPPSRWRSRPAWSATRSTRRATSSPTGSSSMPPRTRRWSCPTCWSTRRSRSCTTSCAARLPARASTRRRT